MMNGFGTFLTNLRSALGLSLEELGALIESNRSTLSRLENGEIPQPFKGAMRRLVIMLASLLCNSQQEVERYLTLAKLDRFLLTDAEEAQLGLHMEDMGVQASDPNYLENVLHSWEQRYQQLDRWEQRIRDKHAKKIEQGESSAYAHLRRKKYESRLRIKELQEKTIKVKSIRDETVKSTFDHILYQALSKYIQDQRSHLLSMIAPGSTNLFMQDIIGKGGLFIPPPWEVAQGVASSPSLIDYLIDAASKRQHVLLLGEAGQGKTTVLKQVFTLMVDHFLEGSYIAPLLPLYIPLRDLDIARGSAIEILWSYINDAFPSSFEVFSFLVKNQQIFFLLDGLDEVKGELTQRLVNEYTSSKIFHYPAILSCRKNFYDFYLSISMIQALYTQKVELQPLFLTNPVIQYISDFCTKKQEKGTLKTDSGVTSIIEIIRSDMYLQDLAQRPLLLTMMLDIFTDTRGTDKHEWSTAKLYQKYTEKWLKNEAAKPDSALKWNEKALLMQEIAWSIYSIKVSTSSPYGLYQNMTFTQRDLLPPLEYFLERYHHYIQLPQLIDDVCLRTFLIANDGDAYYFIHKSFQEYFVALYILEQLRCREHSSLSVANVLQEFFPVEVVRFLKEMFYTPDFLVHDKDFAVETLIQAYQVNNAKDQHSTTIRQNASAYLAYLGTLQARHFLKQAYEKESNKWVQRAMMVGLALFCNDIDCLEKYIDIVRSDSEAASINIGYHLVYYGDQAWENGYIDAGGEKCDGTIRSIFRRLKNKRYENGWALDLLTLHTLLMQRGVHILKAEKDSLIFLKTFLQRDHHKQNHAFQREHHQLQAFLTGVL